ATAQADDPAGAVMRVTDYREGQDGGPPVSSGTELEVTTLCEAFYLLAVRFIDVAKRIDIDIGPKGIRNVRHHFVVHPEKNHVTRGWSFAYGAALPAGPVLRAFGVSGESDNKNEDAGLYANAMELVDALTKRLVNEMPSEEPT